MISFVIAARNDNYGGDFLHRLQVFVNVLLPQINKYKLEAEVIIVEWNPPQDRPDLKDALTWPKRSKPGTARIITVPGTLHNRLPNANRMPMFEFIAKNVGIRRARGNFVLVTNPDILFSHQLIKFLASEQLSENRFYRIDRYEFHGQIPLDMKPRIALYLAKKHTHKVFIREYEYGRDSISIDKNRRWYFLLSGKWPGSYTQLTQRSSPSKKQIVVFNDPHSLYHGIYTNGSGDFLLASSESWNQIKGFPEFTDTFTHLDSYGCYQLKALGLEQVLFMPPCMIFHAEHHRDHISSRPKVSSDKWQSDLQKIQDGTLGPAINDETWGLADEDLPEIII